MLVSQTTGTILSQKVLCNTVPLFFVCALAFEFLYALGYSVECVLEVIRLVFKNIDFLCGLVTHLG